MVRFSLCHGFPTVRVWLFLLRLAFLRFLFFFIPFSLLLQHRLCGCSFRFSCLFVLLSGAVQPLARVFVSGVFHPDSSIFVFPSFPTLSQRPVGADVMPPSLLCSRFSISSVAIVEPFSKKSGNRWFSRAVPFAGVLSGA